MPPTRELSNPQSSELSGEVIIGIISIVLLCAFGVEGSFRGYTQAREFNTKLERFEAELFGLLRSPSRQRLHDPPGPSSAAIIEPIYGEPDNGIRTGTIDIIADVISLNPILSTPDSQRISCDHVSFGNAVQDDHLQHNPNEPTSVLCSMCTRIDEAPGDSLDPTEPAIS